MLSHKATTALLPQVQQTNDFLLKLFYHQIRK